MPKKRFGENEKKDIFRFVGAERIPLSGGVLVFYLAMRS